VPYVLVILREGEQVEQEHAFAAEHEQFIDSLIERNLVLLGGAFAAPVGDANAAYLLRCGSVEEARAIAAEDPYVRGQVASPECVEWELVGINPDAIDPDAVFRPQDVKTSGGR
jgi:uncharacterized protein YciI